MISFCNVFLTHNSLSYPFDITFMSCHHHISQAKQHCSAKLAAALLSTRTIGSLFSQVSRQIMAKNILTMLASKHPIMSNCLEASSILSRRKEHWHIYRIFVQSQVILFFWTHTLEIWQEKLIDSFYFEIPHFAWKHKLEFNYIVGSNSFVSFAKLLGLWNWGKRKDDDDMPK